MQAWGSQSRFTERETEREPTKSGVIGLVCAALGRGREEDVSDLAALRLGVRVDQEGRLERDYHTAGGEDRKVGGTVPTNRYYLADADFLVGLEGPERGFLEQIEAALRAPRWQLYLGRKAFVPTVPPALPGGGLRDLDLRTALEAEPWPLVPRVWRGREGQLPAVQRLRLVLEVPLEEVGRQLRLDQPFGAAYATRRFHPRGVSYNYITVRPNGGGG
jgi:CRISPR system Cascade subunit CasD